MKKTKPKVKQKKSDAENFDYMKTNKDNLLNILKDDSILPIINELVLRTNKIVIHSYQFLKLYLLHLYENNKIVVTDEVNGFLALKPLPTVYIKCGLFSHKFKTNLPPVYSVDSVSLKKVDNDKIEIEIHGNQEDFPDRPTTETVDCNCL